MQKDLFGVILAGGSGSRLWPLSRELYPKQFLSFSEDKTLLQLTYERLEKFTCHENIITVANDKHVAGINYQLRELEEDCKYNVIGEPVAKNTAPALALGSFFIQKNLKFEDNPVIIVAPSDHLIKDNKSFTEAVLEGAEIARQGYIVTFGIKPSSAETGYGYIKVLPEQKIGTKGIKTDCFKEKPDYNAALEYVKSGEYFWNSGIFMFSLSTIMEEFEKRAPEIINKIREIDFENPDSCREIYEQLPSISIDYAIMEKSDKIVLIPAEFDWNDLGSWEAIYGVSGKDNRANAIKGDVIDINCQNSLIYSSSRCVSAIGVSDMIIVETPDAVLACNRKDSQKVKEAFDALKAKNSDLYKTHKTLKETWGSLINLQSGSETSINKIIIRANREFFPNPAGKNLKHYYIARGSAVFRLENSERKLESGKSLDIKNESLVSIKNSASDELEIIEITKHI